MHVRVYCTRYGVSHAKVHRACIIYDFGLVRIIILYAKFRVEFSGFFFFHFSCVWVRGGGGPLVVRAMRVRSKRSRMSTITGRMYTNERVQKRKLGARV